MLDEMLSAKKKKMCWNCDGTVGFDASFCPYCGCDLAQGVEGKKVEKHEPEENLSSLYTPPYSGSSDKLSHHYTEEMAANAVFQSDEEDEPTSGMTQADYGIWPLLFLSLGSILLTLGLLLFFFSDEGKVSLEWNAYYWFLYCLIATPLLMMGWKFLSRESG